MMIDAIQKFSDCEIVGRDHPQYHSARRIYNGLIDRHPIALIYPETSCALLTIARSLLENDVKFSIRAGGHNVAGTCLADNGWVLDTSRLAGVQVNRRARFADVQPGSLWRDFDSATSKFGLCAPGGIISDTGVAGLTLGGGIGWLNGLHGLACDNLLEADVLLSSGELVTASEEDNFDLLWALRGGGGNFGLVTRFRLRLHPLPELYCGSIVYEGREIKEAMHRYFEACEMAPDELTVSFVASTGPGQPRVSLDSCFAGDEKIGRKATDLMLPSNNAHLLRDTRKRFSYVNWQRQFDDDLRRGRRSYWRAIYIRDLTDQGFLSLVQDYLFSAPSAHSMLTVDHVHGASHRVGEATSAYGDRSNKYLFLINTNWDKPQEDAANMEWCNSLFRDLQPFSTQTTYVNYLSREGGERVKAAFAGKFDRLQRIKGKFDPSNRFRGNQNIPPVREEGAPLGLCV